MVCACVQRGKKDQVNPDVWVLVWVCWECGGCGKWVWSVSVMCCICEDGGVWCVCVPVGMWYTHFSIVTHVFVSISPFVCFLPSFNFICVCLTCRYCGCY